MRNILLGAGLVLVGMALGQALPSRRAEAAPAQVTVSQVYKVIMETDRDSEQERHLNNLAYQGWRVVGMAGTESAVFYTLTRPAPGAPPPPSAPPPPPAAK